MNCANLSCKAPLQQYRIDAFNEIGKKRKWKYRFCGRCINTQKHLEWKCKGCNNILRTVTHGNTTTWCSNACRRKNSEYSTWVKRYQSGKYKMKIKSVYCTKCNGEIPYVLGQYRTTFCNQCKAKILNKINNKVCSICKNTNVPLNNSFCRNCKYEFKWGILKNKKQPIYKRRCIICSKVTINSSFCSRHCLNKGRYLYNSMPNVR